MKKRLYIDMDGVLCDFKKGVVSNILPSVTDFENEFPQSKLGFFILLEPISGSIEAVKELEKHFDVWILSRPSFFNLHCYTEKAIWIRKHLGYDMQKKLILCGDKSLCKGDYLIDDMTTDGQDRFEGQLILFGSQKFPDWSAVLEYMLKEVSSKDREIFFTKYLPVNEEIKKGDVVFENLSSGKQELFQIDTENDIDSKNQTKAKLFICSRSFKSGDLVTQDAIKFDVWKESHVGLEQSLDTFFTIKGVVSESINWLKEGILLTDHEATPIHIHGKKGEIIYTDEDMKPLLENQWPIYVIKCPKCRRFS